jgi:hypothetical protein
MIDSRGDCPRHRRVLFAAGVVGGEDPDMFHQHLIWFTSKAVYLESSEVEHFVGVFGVIDGDQTLEELLLAFEAACH